MENTRPAILFENREFYYTILSKSPSDIVIDMYNTRYHLVKDKEGNWINHNNNRFNMAKGLINAVIETLQP